MTDALNKTAATAKVAAGMVYEGGKAAGEQINRKIDENPTLSLYKEKTKQNVNYAYSKT